MNTSISNMSMNSIRDTSPMHESNVHVEQSLQIQKERMSSFKRFAESKISDSSESLQEMKLLRDDHFQPMCWLEDSRTPSLRHEHGDTTTSEERVNNKECSSCHRKGAKRNH